MHLPKDCRKEVLDTLRLIVNNPSIKHKEIAERLAVSERTAGTYVAELKRYCIKRVPRHGHLSEYARTFVRIGPDSFPDRCGTTLSLIVS